MFDGNRIVPKLFGATYSRFTLYYVVCGFMFIMFMVHHYIIYSVIFLQLNKLLVAKECGCSDVIHWSDESKLTKNNILKSLQSEVTRVQTKVSA